MFFFTYTAAVLTILFVGAAVFLFLKGNKDTLTHIFTLYIFANVFWIGGNAVADISHSDQMLILSSGIAFVGSSCIVTFFLIFVDTFVDGHIPSFKRLTAYGLPSILFAIFSFSKYAVLDTIYPPNAPAQIVPGIQYYFFLCFLVVGLVYALTRLFIYYVHSTGVKRLQTLYITIGFLALFIGGVTFGLILPLFGEFRFYNLAPQFSFILALTSGYAILKHNLLDIRIVIQRGFIYSVLFFSIVSFYLSIITFTGFFLNQVTPTVILINAGITTVLGIFTVPHIDRFLRKKTDAFFFKDAYDYADALYELSEKIHKSVLLEDIQTLTEETLQKILKTHSVEVAFAAEDALLTLTRKQDELQKNTLTVPIIFDGSIIGSIFLGEKKSGDLYTEEDVVLIKTFAHQVAAAFEKAKLYSEVQAYSQELEKRVEERTLQIRHMQEMQTHMMLDISHKLQNPLTIVKSQLALLRKNTDKPDDFIFFEHTIDKISTFIYDLLHLAQLEALPVEQHTREVQNLSAHMEELVEYFEVMAQSDGVTMEKFIEPGITHNYNKAQITELITNLVSNAVKYKNPKIKNKWIKVALMQEGKTHIKFEISDNGLGIPAADLPHIFDRFYRTEVTRSIKGTGLGLAISQKITQLHGGTIEAQSDQERGTVFTILLPRQ